MHYFAYGSNMSIPRLRARLPDATPIETYQLSKHRLCFHKVGQDGSGKCDIQYTGQAEDYVLGVLYELNPDDKKELDQIEGLGKGYAEKEVELSSMTGQHCTAWSYYAIQTKPGLKPFSWYKQHVLFGAEQAGLPASYIQMIELVPATEDPDNDRAAVQLAVYPVS
ncbi:gamma-glutamylcyclotransferase [Dongshaea marina]|uniref:gamma-glutamylcyclotransferase n=1 Tax=Dongshaea marina TaxID=2047966 RepID=UPI000D3EBC5B|nr:gamma-glutamylcyclotransferase [Dongshaea marina]